MLFKDILKSDNLMRHRMQVSDVPDRRPWLNDYCADKSVLHVGCCDVPVFDANNNLHIELSKTTDRIDGLDISEPGISELKRHVYSDYFTDPGKIEKQYDLVLAPEVLEHTLDAHSFLKGLFSVHARRYVITAPDIQWYAQSQRFAGTCLEEVHGDHRAWYSPYTLLNAVRPFIDEDEDELQLFLIQKLGSVAIEVKKRRSINAWARQDPALELEGSPLERAQLLISGEKTAEALYVLEKARQAEDSAALYYSAAELLVRLGRHLDAFRESVVFMKKHPSDRRCMLLAADAAEGLNQQDQAKELRQMAAHSSSRLAPHQQSRSDPGSTPKREQ